jgi:putative glycosyltransferase (TIGR04372 family)
VSLRKLWAGGLILVAYAGGSAGAIRREFSCSLGAGGRELGRCAVRTARGLWHLARVILRLANGEKLVRLCGEVAPDDRRLRNNPDTAYFLAQFLIAEQRFEDVLGLMTPLAERYPRSAKCQACLGTAHLHLGNYREALEYLTRCHQLHPVFARGMHLNYQRAFLHGFFDETGEAREAVAAQVGLPKKSATGAALAGFLHERLEESLDNLGLKGTVGIFFCVTPTALGHAILDPFHHIKLFAARFDNLVMVQPDLETYSPATRQSVGILEQYVETVRCDDAEVLSFAWQNLGELRHGQFTYLVFNYWSLNHLVFRARWDTGRGLPEAPTYLRPPPKMGARAEALLRHFPIDLSRPVVVVHTRESGYHGLRGQQYRDVRIENYAPALRELAAEGYQVVRIGDAKMTRLGAEVPGLIELPFADHYSPVLDPYLIARCEFMISCQSGPCSYARAFGKPNLVLNAVYHHSLLVENQELIAFKQYRDRATGEILGVEELFRRGVHLFDRTPHFENSGLELIDMTAEEVSAAVREMRSWLREPDRPETSNQKAFRRLMARYCREDVLPFPLSTPLTNYVGYALPECRIADSVVELRPGSLPAGPKEIRAAA